MRDERLQNIDPSSWAHESLIGQLREWTPRAPVRVITSDANINPPDGLILVSGTTTVTLETAMGADGRCHNIINIGTDTVTIACTGTETINGASTLTLSAQYDGVIVFPDGSNWLSVAKPGSGSGGGSIGGIAVPAGQCQLLRNSATELILSRYRGKYVTFPSGVTVEVPSAGVTLSNSGLSASTLYYIYAVTSDDVEVTSLEASTTGYDFDSSYGIAKKQGSGNETRALQGMVRTNGSTQFVDTSTQRFVRTWHNDKGVTLAGAAVGGGTSSTSYAAQTSVGPSTGGIEFLAYASEWVDVSWVGYHRNNTGGEESSMQMYLNGAVSVFGIPVVNVSSASDDVHAFHCHNVAITGTAGYNFINGYAKVTGGTMTTINSQLVGHTRGGGDGV